MLTGIFKYESREEGDFLGFRPEFIPTGEAGGGRLAMHDLLEHFPKDDGSFEAEMQALGAMFYLRWAESGLIPHTEWASALARNIFNDLTGILEDFEFNGVLPKSIIVKSFNTSSIMVDNYFVQAAELLRDKLNAIKESEIVSRLQDDGRASAELAADLVNWCRRGYRRARARYAKCYNTYGLMQHTVPEIVQHLDNLEDLTEGDRVRVSLSLQTLAWKVSKVAY